MGKKGEGGSGRQNRSEQTKARESFRLEVHFYYDVFVSSPGQL